MTSQEDALDAFCRREHRRLVGTLSLYCGDVGVAEEIAQEALYRACRQWSEVQVMKAPGTWVHRVAINIANSFFRRRRAERRAAQRNRTHGAADGDPTDAVAVRRAVAGLPSRQRAAVVLRHYGHYTVAETAELLGVTEGAVKQLTHRAVTALRDQLADDTTASEVPDAR